MGSVWVPGVSLPLWPPQNKNERSSRCVWVISVLCSGCLQCLIVLRALPVYSLTWVCVFGGVFSVGRLVPVCSLNTSRCFHFWSIYPIIYWGPTQQLSLLLDA